MKRRLRNGLKIAVTPFMKNLAVEFGSLEDKWPPTGKEYPPVAMNVSKIPTPSTARIHQSAVFQFVYASIFFIRIILRHIVNQISMYSWFRQYFEKLAGNIKGGFVDIAAEFIKKDCTKINDETEIPFNGEMAFNETVWPVEYPDHQFCLYYNQIAEILVKKRVKGGRKTGK